MSQVIQQVSGRVKTRPRSGLPPCPSASSLFHLVILLAGLKAPCDKAGSESVWCPSVGAQDQLSSECCSRLGERMCLCC